MKYLFVFTIYPIYLFSIMGHGFETFSMFIYAFLVIPTLEFIFPIYDKNLSPEEEKEMENSFFYDLLIYLNTPLLCVMFFLFLQRVQAPLTGIEAAGIINSLGILLAIVGINIGHELGHRNKFVPQLLAHINFLLPQYLHFLIDHNRGHHRMVATPGDPATAPKGMNVYFFVLRALVITFRSSWRLEKRRLESKNQRVWSFRNIMILYSLAQISLLVLVYFFFGLKVLLSYIAAALMGSIFLETINYIEHYGLLRKKNPSGRYEKVSPKHSWNSDHIIGRLLLFELTRHSDHHENANRKYQILRSLDDAPNLPFGYPLMIILSLIPPLFFSIMDKRLPKD